MNDQDRKLERTPVIIRSVMNLDEGRTTFLLLLERDPNRVVARFASDEEARSWVKQSTEFVLAP